MNFTTAAQAATGDTFAAKAAAARAAEVAPALRAALREKTRLKQKTPVTLTGGAAWALAALVKPASAGLPLVPVGAADVKAFKALLATTPGRFPAVDLGGIADPGAKKRAEQDIARVRDAYTVENLVAAAELLDAVFAAFEFEKAPVSFARGGDVALALAAVTPEPVRVAARPKEPKAPEPAPKTEPTPPMTPPVAMPVPVPPPGAPPAVGAMVTYPPAPVAVGPRVAAAPATRFSNPRVGLFGRLRGCR